MVSSLVKAGTKSLIFFGGFVFISCASMNYRIDEEANVLGSVSASWTSFNLFHIPQKEEYLRKKAISLLKKKAEKQGFENFDIKIVSVKQVPSLFTVFLVTFNVFADVRQTRTSGAVVTKTLPLNFYGVYYYETKSLIMYLRFFEDGRVISANVAGKFNPGLERWFTADYTDNAGTYSLEEDGRIKFTTTAAEGDVTYEGTIDDEKGLVLNWQSGINNHKEKKVLYEFARFR
jgi:hypothetical protein